VKNLKSHPRQTRTYTSHPESGFELRYETPPASKRFEPLWLVVYADTEAVLYSGTLDAAWAFYNATVQSYIDGANGAYSR
jgi:hypothetical protein